MRRFFFIIGLFVVMLSACRSTRQVVQQTSSDSTSVTFKEVEKIISVPGDTVSVRMQAALPSTGSGIGALINGTLPEREAVEGSFPLFIPQVQIIETKRTKVRIELTKSGEIKAIAISKKLDEKVSVLEKTVRTSTNSVSVIEQKESWFQRTLKAAKRSFNTILTVALIAVFIYVFIRFKGRILNLFK